jgi:hypothetical protein
MKNGFYTFEDLFFEKRYYNNILENGYQAKMFFANGYGVSVIIGGGALGDGAKPYEIAILKGTKDEWTFFYENPIGDYIISYLTANDVTKYMIEVQKLARGE